MMVRLRDLSAAQIRLMSRLDDGFPHEDSVGREIDGLRAHEHRTADSLVDLGLVELRPGYGLQFWYRLTEAGRKVRNEG